MVDDKKNLTGDQIRAQLADTSDIVQAANVAPPTKLRYIVAPFYFTLCYILSGSPIVSLLPALMAPAIG